MHCIEFPGSNSIIMRKTMPDLKRTVIDKFLNDVPKSLYEKGSQERGMFNKSEHIVYFPPDRTTGKQSKLYFGACERIEDVGKYLSTEFLFIGFEELGEFPYLIYDAMEGRNRCTIPGTRPCMAGATNPMGIGWGWIKRLWVDRLPAYGMDPDKYNPDDYSYIHSTVDDNPILNQDLAYIQSLEKSPNRDKIRWGKLDTVSGQYFSNFDPRRHILPKEAFIFEPWQPVWVGWDYGFGHFAVLTFWTKAILKPRFEGEKPRLVNVTIGELVLQEKTPEQQTSALIAAIPRTYDEEGHEKGYAWDIDSIHFSWERFNRTTSNRTVADEVGDLLSAAGLPRPTRSNNDRVAGWMKMYSMLEVDEWFMLQGQCPNVAESVPLLVRGDGVTHSIEDVIKPKGVSLIDDCGDSCLVAGTLIDTARGLIPIETVTTKDFVLTRKGFKRVLWAGPTGIKPVMKLDSLLATPNHPIFTDGHFMAACDILSPCLLTRRRSYSEASRIDDIPSQNERISETISVERNTDVAHSFTSKFTRSIMELCQEARKFITWILIPSTISRRISSLSLTGSTVSRTAIFGPAFVAASSSSQATSPITHTGDIVPRNAGDSRHPAKTATQGSRETGFGRNSAPMPANPHGEGKAGLTMWQRFVTVAATIFPPIATRLFGFVPVHAPMRDRCVVLLSARPVFNISVEDEQEYFANGILVHNCRYAVAGVLLDAGEKPREQLLREKLAGIKDPFTRQIIGYKEWNQKQAEEKRQAGGGKIIPTWQRRLNQ